MVCVEYHMSYAQSMCKVVILSAVCGIGPTIAYTRPLVMKVRKALHMKFNLVDRFVKLSWRLQWISLFWLIFSFSSRKWTNNQSTLPKRTVPSKPGESSKPVYYQYSRQRWHSTDSGARRVCTTALSVMLTQDLYESLKSGMI